ncbi:hypothetical protein D8M03_14830 [Lysinibacillus endophyticus]|uniref:Uncharacterized protein n=1 Tax=Ureibacillus endophyticus TaxID=1978490 RepID=A0A494YUY8_9BACL|nr:hypothetical protein D8M03_14830 [Lysinibacillus endophyticus]
MFNILYKKYKLSFWIILGFLFIIGGISNLFTGTLWEVALNIVLGIVCIIIAMSILFKQKNRV